jgi:hypothetical protein
MVILFRIPFQELSTAEVLAEQLRETTLVELGKMQVKKTELEQEKELYKIVFKTHFSNRSEILLYNQLLHLRIAALFELFLRWRSA